MRRDWNERAVEDAHFFVAFGRRGQAEEEFFASASDVVRSLEQELKRLPAGKVRARRALEIGCGPGRLLRPMSAHFGEIHGIDVSDEMIRRAEANLRGIPHAHVHHTSGADLAPFADESFDFVYSYAVFQHIPSREVVMEYLGEAHRVLKPGGLLRVQINGLDPEARQYDTWSGVRITAEEVREFARAHGMQLLALEGVRTQYMWTSMRKPAPAPPGSGACRLRRITNAHNSEPVAPPEGRFASLTLWVENLPHGCDLNSLAVRVENTEGFACYIGPPEAGGLQQLNVILPRLPRSGLLPVEVLFEGRPLFERAYVRIIPPGPPVPFLVSVTDGIDLLAGTRIVTGTVKAAVEEARDFTALAAEIDAQPVSGFDVFCTDPLPPRHEINFRVPDGVRPGERLLVLRLGRRVIGRTMLNIEPR